MTDRQRDYCRNTAGRAKDRFERAIEQIERGSAASIFTSIADKLANKAMEELGKAQLKAQQEANKIATQTLQAISVLPFGLQ